MTKKVQNPENDLMVETKGKLEIFFEKYGNKTLKLVIGVAIVAAITAAAIYLSSKNEEGQRRGQVLVEKIKSKLPKKKTAEVEETEEFAEEECECTCEIAE